MTERFQNWVCGHCKKEYRSFEPKKPIVLDSKENKAVTVCATCHKELYQAKRIVMEYK